MMQLINNPLKTEWPDLVKRPEQNRADISGVVNEIFSAVQQHGDEGLRKYAHQLDGFTGGTFKAGEENIKHGGKRLSPGLKKAIRLAYRNIYAFHKAQVYRPVKISTMRGVKCSQELRPIHTVGLYIPGGTAPLFSTVLMLGIPAQIAGCKNIYLTTPATSPEEIHPAILYAAKCCGITEIFCAGGIQAIAAMCIGTGTIPKADKIFGPGNQYVTAAKMKAQEYGVAIDMPAGPSEVLVIADKTAVPAFVAADLLSQAEHGPDSQVMLLGNDKKILNEVLEELEKQLQSLPRKGVAAEALAQSKIILFDDLETCVAFSNAYAPEHLILAVKQAGRWVKSIQNAGSIFLGNFSCESAGDYASGTNHCLPTNGFARSYSGLSVAAFQKTISVQQVSKKGLQGIGPSIEIMAETEQLLAHKNAVSIRLADKPKEKKKKEK